MTMMMTTTTTTTMLMIMLKIAATTTTAKIGSMPMMRMAKQIIIYENGV